MATVWDGKVNAILECAHTWAQTPGSPADCAATIRGQIGPLGIDSAELADTIRQLRRTSIDPAYCRAVADLLEAAGD